MNRRQLIALAASVGATWWISSSRSSRDKNLPESLFSQSQLVHLIAAEIAPLIADNTDLEAMAGIRADADFEAQRQAFATKRRSDFLIGRTLTVRGWVMAEAECALCMLAATGTQPS